MANSHFQFLVYNKDTAKYAHFGYSPDMALLRAVTDLKRPEKDFVVVDMGDKACLEYVANCYRYSLEDVVNAGGKIVAA